MQQTSFYIKSGISQNTPKRNKILGYFCKNKSKPTWSHLLVLNSLFYSTRNQEMLDYRKNQSCPITLKKHKGKLSNHFEVTARLRMLMQPSEFVRFAKLFHIELNYQNVLNFT